MTGRQLTVLALIAALSGAACGAGSDRVSPAVGTVAAPVPVEAAPPAPSPALVPAPAPVPPPVPPAAASVPPPAPAPPPAPRAAPAPRAPERARTAAALPAPVARPIPRQPGGLVNHGGDRHATVDPQEIGVIEIPRLGIVHPVVEGIELSQLHWGPGHWPGTALPGQTGNVVFAGHRVTHTRPFLDIDRLVPGDQVIFKLPGGTFVYEITGSQVVSPSDVHIVDQTPDPTMTLFACHPKGSARQRYVVRGRLLPG